MGCVCMSANFTDKQLVEKVQNGDKKAFDLLVMKYQQRITNLIFRFVHNFSDAQDVAQEAFIKAYLALPKFRGESAFYTWLYRIAANTAKNHLSTKHVNLMKLSQNIDDIEQIGKTDTLSDQETPEHCLLRDEIQTAVMETVESLPDTLRIVITLREIDGLSYAEIADIMDCPIGTIRSRIFRAREEIDKKLKPLID